jgi:hypothetical protein
VASQLVVSREVLSSIELVSLYFVQEAVCKIGYVIMKHCLFVKVLLEGKGTQQKSGFE